MYPPMTPLPLTLRSITPGPCFTSLPVPLREGFHTGGPYLSPDGNEVWKPCDARPFPSSDCLVVTHEVEVLEAMAGCPGFPRNWRVEEVNGRGFLVRPLVPVLPDTWPDVRLDQILFVEQAVRSLNARGWSIGEGVLRVALDLETYDPFILDLSAAARLGEHADDNGAFERWAELVGASRLVKLRSQARHVVNSVEWELGPYGRTHHWVYGSPNRPVSYAWCKDIPDAVFVAADCAATRMHTWVVVPQALDEQLVQRYELVWGWGPLCPASQNDNEHS